MMDSRQSSFSRVSSVNVCQLDKINAIPNKTTDNALMSGLCQEDQLYLEALMEDDSSSDKETTLSGRSTWSPMAQSPTMMGKRIKKRRPTYAITLSLEDISYIRPSWGLSKGIKTIELNKSPTPKRKQAELERKAVKEKSENNKSSERVYRYFLVLLTLGVFLLVVPPYVIDNRRATKKVQVNKMRVTQESKTIEIYRPTSETLNAILKIQYGQGIPNDLKPDRIACSIFEEETIKYNRDSQMDAINSTCFTSFDWPMRANVRVRVSQDPEQAESICYHVRWQSYDTLRTPLIDCFLIGQDEQWFGLGDFMGPNWQLNKLTSDWTPLVTNLSAEFPNSVARTSSQTTLSLGSLSEVSLYSTSGIHVHNLSTDFSISMKISHDLRADSKRICLMASCNERCSQSWTRANHLDKFRFKNNALDYSVCSGANTRALMSDQIDRTTRELASDAKQRASSSEFLIDKTVAQETNRKSLKMIETETRVEKLVIDPARANLEPVAAMTAAPDNAVALNRPDGIGLIDRTIFTTSQEFMPSLDGQTLRQYVDTIVKLGLKTSSILLVDTRWENYAGSLKLNLALFPKSKLLLEILHNKGFKIVLSIKPYIDSAMGVDYINSLFDSNRLYAASYETASVAKGLNRDIEYRTNVTINEVIVRRKSLFSYKNETIAIKTMNNLTSVPYLFKCKESRNGYCTLIDLSITKNQLWMRENIKKSSLLINETDGIQFEGAHPIGTNWDDHYRAGASEFVRNLFYKDNLYVLPKWTRDFGYIQLMPRPFTWDALRSIIGSTLNLGAMGYSLVNPGSVWGDLKGVRARIPDRMESIYGDLPSPAKIEEELSVRWLQVAVFLPVLQFNDLSPIERHGLQEILQNLIKMRKTSIVPEMKKHLPFTPLISGSQPHSAREVPRQLPLIRSVWYNQDSGETLIESQFMVGPDILVAPILSENLRQRDIYLPSGFWHDELRQVNLRGGKWLRNYPIELYEIAWFTRMRK